MEKIKLKTKVKPKVVEEKKPLGRLNFANSGELCQHIAELSEGTAIISFSNGKDSIGTWLQMKKYFSKIVPVYFYYVPDLEFIEQGLQYYENLWNTHIFRLPHPSLYRQLNNFMFQPLDRVNAIREFGFPNFSYDDAFGYIKADENLPPSTFVGTGVRVADNPLRAVSIKTHGAVNYKRYQFFPVYDWGTPYLMQQINEAKVKLPVDYDLFGRSLDGIQELYLKPIKEKYPNDFERILEFFPLAELELKRIEYREEYYKTHQN